MSTKFLNDPACAVDIYEVEDGDDYVDCAVSRAYFGLYTLTGLLIVVIIVLAAIGAWGLLVPVVIIGGLLFALSAVNAFWFAKWNAKRQYRAVDYEIESTMRAHEGKLTRGDAINIIRQERLQREQAQSRLDAATIHARSNAQGFSSLANALSRK